MSLSNSNAFLRTAAQLYKGDLSTGTAALKDARETVNGTRWTIGVNLICHAAQRVFSDENSKVEYTRAKARRFKEDVVAEFGISPKQAGKWTEAISAALGVRGVRKGVKGIPGLSVVACESFKAAASFLNDRDIKTWNQFLDATRTEMSPIEALAKQYHKFSESQRERVLAIVKKLDDDETATDESVDTGK